MKVVHITSSIRGGAGIATCRIHESLMQDGRVESHILQKDWPSQEMISKNIAQHTHFHSLSYRIQKKLGLLSHFSKFEQYKKLISQEPRDYEIVNLPYSYYPLHENKLIQEADIIHLHWVADFIDYPTFFKNTTQPIVWTLHDMHPFLGIYHYKGDMDKNTNPILSRIDKEIYQIKKECIKKRDNIHIVTPSEWLYEFSKSSETFKGLPHLIVANCFDSDSYKIANKKDICKDILDISKSKKTILFVADNINIERKGIDLLIDALQNVSIDYCTIISVGSGSIENLLPPNVDYKHFGSINNPIFLNQVYSAADITIVPSREDNLPNVVFESMLNGTPVISFKDGGGMAEHIINGENGILVDDINSKALTEAINKFLEGEYTFDPLTVQQYPIDNFNYKKQADLYFKLYQSILEK